MVFEPQEIELSFIMCVVFACLIVTVTVSVTILVRKAMHAGMPLFIGPHLLLVYKAPSALAT